jgi:hypothetical protein
MEKPLWDDELATRITIGFMEQMQASNIPSETALIAAVRIAAIICIHGTLSDKLAIDLFKNMLKTERQRGK